MERPREEQHRPDRVAGVGERVRPWPIRKLIAQSLLPNTFQITGRSRRRRCSECVKPTPGQPRWNCAGLDAFRSQGAEVDPVDEPLRHHVRRVRADQQRHERDLQAAGAAGSRTARGRVRPSSPTQPPERRGHEPRRDDRYAIADRRREQEVDRRRRRSRCRRWPPRSSPRRRAVQRGSGSRIESKPDRDRASDVRG